MSVCDTEKPLKKRLHGFTLVDSPRVSGIFGAGPGANKLKVTVQPPLCQVRFIQLCVSGKEASQHNGLSSLSTRMLIILCEFTCDIQIIVNWRLVDRVAPVHSQ